MITKGENGIFMQDNARSSVARVVKKYLDKVGIRCFDWLALSSDLNPLKHVEDELKQRIKKHKPSPRNIQELKKLLLWKWKNIDQHVIFNLIETMLR